MVGDERQPAIPPRLDDRLLRSSPSVQAPARRALASPFRLDNGGVFRHGRASALTRQTRRLHSASAGGRGFSESRSLCRCLDAYLFLVTVFAYDDVLPLYVGLGAVSNPGRSIQSRRRSATLGPMRPASLSGLLRLSTASIPEFSRREAAMSDINPILVYLAEQRRQDLLREAEQRRLVRSLVVRLENIKFLQPGAAEKRIKEQ